MSKKLLGWGFLALALMALFACEKENVEPIIPDDGLPHSSLELKVEKQFFLGDREYIIKEYYDSTQSRLSDIPEYMRDDLFVFHEGMSERHDNDFLNPWESYTVKYVPYDVMTEDDAVWLEWQNVLTDEPTVFRVEKAIDENCSVVVSFVDVDGIRIFIRLAKVL